MKIRVLYRKPAPIKPKLMVGEILVFCKLSFSQF